MAFRVVVDRDLCQGHGVCESEAPTVFAVSKSARNFYAEKAMGGIAGFVAAPFMRRAHLAYTRKTTHEVMRGITSNQKLIGVLTGQYGDYGLPPKQSSFAMHASVAKHYFFGGNYPIGGSARFVETIAPKITAGGGLLLTCAHCVDGVEEPRRGSSSGQTRLLEGSKFSGLRVCAPHRAFRGRQQKLTRLGQHRHRLPVLLADPLVAVPLDPVLRCARELAGFPHECFDDGARIVHTQADADRHQERQILDPRAPVVAEAGEVDGVDLLAFVLGDMAVGVEKIVLVGKFIAGEDHGNAHRRQQAGEG